MTEPLVPLEPHLGKPPDGSPLVAVTALPGVTLTDDKASQFEKLPDKSAALSGFAYRRAVGIDVHSNLFVASFMSLEPYAQNEKGDCLRWKLAKTDANNESLDNLVKLIVEFHPHIVAFESTGIYGHALFDKLDLIKQKLPPEDRFVIHVVNARDYKQKAGSKTDRNDANHLAKCALFKITQPSFMPSAWVRETKKLNRVLGSLRKSKQQIKNRLHKHLKQAGLNTNAVFSSTVGTASKMLILDAITASQSPEQWDEFSQFIPAICQKYRIKAEPDDVEAALRNNATDADRFAINMLYKQLEQTEAWYQATFDELCEQVIVNAADEVKLLKTIPGISQKGAICIIAEIGTDMSSFANVRKFGKWLGLAPGNSISANTHRNVGTGHGNPHVRTILIEAAHAVARSKRDVYACHRANRMKEKRGKLRGVVATAHYLARVIYAVLRDKRPYEEPGEDVLKHHRLRRAQRSIRGLTQCGLIVTGELQVRDEATDNVVFTIGGKHITMASESPAEPESSEAKPAQSPAEPESSEAKPAQSPAEPESTQSRAQFLCQSVLKPKSSQPLFGGRRRPPRHTELKPKSKRGSWTHNRVNPLNAPDMSCGFIIKSRPRVQTHGQEASDQADTIVMSFDEFD